MKHHRGTSMARREWEASVRQDDTHYILAIEAALRRAEATTKGGGDEQEGDGEKGGAEGEAGGGPGDADPAEEEDGAG